MEIIEETQSILSTKDLFYDPSVDACTGEQRE
jgi:hypothetical protein